MVLLTDLVRSGRVIDLILALTLLEAAALLWLHRSRGRGVAPRDFIVNLLAGCLLLLAMRGYVGGAGWPVIALCLLLAGAAHAGDLAWRWRRAGSTTAATE